MNFIKKALLRRKYKNGALISNFVAHDIRKDIIVVDDSRIDEEILIIKERIVDCLSLSKIGDYEIPDFSEEKAVKIDRIWNFNL